MPADVVELTPERLRDRPLPDPTEASDKNDRGIVLVVGGSAETTGAVVLAGLAALRVGAGKLQLATVASGQPPIAAAVAEARVVGLDEADGSIVPSAAARIAELAARVDALVIGPGMLDPDLSAALTKAVLAQLSGDAVVVVDALALGGVTPPVPPRTVLIPNLGELSLLGADGDDPATAVRELSDRFGCVVAARGEQTWVTAPGEPVFLHTDGVSGLATSGSGDTLAGALGGVASTGADPLTATLWAVAVHAAAGTRLAKRIAPVGFLAREILDELPVALDERRNPR